MKKAISVLLILVIIVSLVACAPKEEEWRQFIKEYEAWVDNYIAIVQKYQKNPTDASIMSDYTKMIAEAKDWTERAEKIKDELKDANAMADFSAELLRISSKIANAAN